MSHTLASRWTDPTFLEYIKLFSIFIQQATVQSHLPIVLNEPFEVRTEYGTYKVTMPEFESVDHRIDTILDLLRSSLNTLYGSLLDRSNKGEDDETSQHAALTHELAELMMYKQWTVQSELAQKKLERTNLKQKLKAARRDINAENKHGSKKAVESVIRITRHLLDYLNNHATDAYVISRELIYVKTMPIIEQISSDTNDKTVKKKEKEKVKKTKLKSKSKTPDDVLKQNEQIKMSVLPKMSPFKSLRKRFKTEEECNSSNRKERFYVSKKELIEMIKNKSELSKEFPGIHKMDKGAICGKLFSFADGKVKI